MIRAPGLTIAEARLWQKATAPHVAAMKMIRDSIEALFGEIAEIEPSAAAACGSDSGHCAEEIIAALQRIAARTGGSRKFHSEPIEIPAASKPSNDAVPRPLAATPLHQSHRH